MKTPIARRRCRIPWLLAGAGLLLPAMQACDQAPPKPEQPQVASTHRAVFVADDINGRGYKVLQNAAAWLPRRMKGVATEVIAPREASAALQQELIERLPRSVDILFITPIDGVSLKKCIADRVQLGAAVFLIGMDVPGSNRTAYSGPSEIQAGAAAAKACAALSTGGTTSVLLLHAGVDRPIFGNRLAGFQQEVASVPRVSVLREIDCHDNWIEALRKVRQETRLYPRTGAWVFLGDWALQGLKVNEALFPAGGPAVVLCGGVTGNFEPLKNGQVNALLTYDFYKAVHEAMYCAIAWSDSRQRLPLTDKTIPSEIITPRELENYEERWKQWQIGP